MTFTYDSTRGAGDRRRPQGNRFKRVAAPVVAVDWQGAYAAGTTYSKGQGVTSSGDQA